MFFFPHLIWIYKIYITNETRIWRGSKMIVNIEFYGVNTGAF